MLRCMRRDRDAFRADLRNYTDSSGSACLRDRFSEDTEHDPPGRIHPRDTCVSVQADIRKPCRSSRFRRNRT